jgi:hypothetical protein
VSSIGEKVSESDSELGAAASKTVAGGDDDSRPKPAADQGSKRRWIRWRRNLSSLYSAILFAAIVSALFQNWEVAWMLTASLAVHELGHVVAVSRFGIEWELGFGPMGAWMSTPLRLRQALGELANSFVHLAGPLASLLLALAGLGLHLTIDRKSGNDTWLRLANLNALVALVNLLPLGYLSDGGKVVQRIFASADERLEVRLLAMAGVLPLSAVAVALALRLDWVRIVALAVPVLWFGLSLWLESRRDDPLAAQTPGAMAPRQIRLLLANLMAMLVLGMILAAMSPFWLTKAQLLNMAQGLAAMWAYLFGGRAAGL